MSEKERREAACRCFPGLIRIPGLPRTFLEKACARVAEK